MNSKWFGCALIAAATQLGSDLPAAAPVDTQATLDAWIAGKPGGVTAAWVDAEGVTFFQAGKFSASDARTMGPNTLFEIGSISKVFTALLLADSVSVGKIGLDDAVGAPFARSAITYRQLATHTSGLPAIPADVMAGDPSNPYGGQTVETLKRSFDGLSGAAKESAWSYSNFGFAVLGQAVAGAWGEPYEKLLAERVLAPLGMGGTKLSWRAADPALLPPGHAEDGRGLTPNWDMAAYAPAGALVSSAADLARFVQANLGMVKTPLAARLDEIAKPQKPVGEGGQTEIGLAWLIERRGVALIVQHGGGTGGYRSFVAFDKTKGIGVVVLTNHADDVGQVGHALITDSLSGLRAKLARESAPPDESVAEFLGNYPLAPEFVIAITAAGRELALQATNQSKFKLRKKEQDRFSVVGVDAEISFTRGADGKVDGLVLHQDGSNLPGKRIGPGEKAAAQALPAEVALDAVTLAEYPGRYPLAPAFVLTVTVEAGTVFVQATGQEKLPLVAEAKDEFFLKVVDARVSFTRGADGKVAGIVLRQGGRDTPGKRME